MYVQKQLIRLEIDTSLHKVLYSDIYNNPTFHSIGQMKEYKKAIDSGI